LTKKVGGEKKWKALSTRQQNQMIQAERKKENDKKRKEKKLRERELLFN